MNSQTARRKEKALLAELYTVLHTMPPAEKRIMFANYRRQFHASKYVPDDSDLFRVLSDGKMCELVYGKDGAEKIFASMVKGLPDTKVCQLRALWSALGRDAHLRYTYQEIARMTEQSGILSFLPIVLCASQKKSPNFFVCLYASGKPHTTSTRQWSHAQSAYAWLCMSTTYYTRRKKPFPLRW